MSKPNLHQAADQVRAVARQFQAVIDLAEALDGIASIEQAANEAKNRLEKARREAEELEALAKKAKDELEQSQKASDAIMHNAKQGAVQIHQEATARAEAIIATAKQTADRSIQEAGEAVIQSRNDLAKVEQRKSEAAQTLSDLETRIARARTSIRELLQ